MLRKKSCILVVLLVCAAVASGQTVTVHLDPAKSKIQWTLSDPLHTVHGTFALREGTISYDVKTGAASGLIVVDTKSGESGNSSRDNKMHKEVLESQRFPDTTFRPQHVTGTLNRSGRSTLAVDGIFSLHGSDHPLTMNVTAAPSPDQTAITIAGEFQVPYVQWGLKDPSVFLLRVGKDVTVDILAAGSLSTQ